MLKQLAFRYMVLSVMVVLILSACQGEAPAATNTPAPTNTPVPTATQPPAPTAAPVVKSGDGNVPVSVVFENETSETLKINWMNLDGEEEPYAELPPSSSQSFETFSTHIWRIRDTAGNVLSDVVATEEKLQRYVIDSDKQVTAEIYNPCKLPSLTQDYGVAEGFPPIEDRMDSTGTVRAAVLFVDFPDMPGRKSAEQLYKLLSGTTDFYKTVSYERMDWQLEPYLTLLHMEHTTAELGLADNDITFDEQRLYLQEAMDLADANVDFSGMQAVYVISDPDASPTYFGPAFTGNPGAGITADGNEMLSGVTSGTDLAFWGFIWLNHEVGHTMGLPDHYAYQADPNNYYDYHRFVGGFGLMGNHGEKAPEPFAFDRWQLGWLDDEQMFCQITADETIVLSAVEKPGGIKAAVVPTGPNTAVVVESRRAMGYDSKLPKGGALVYTIDTSIYSGEGPVRVVPIQPNDMYRYKSPLGVGESVTVENVTVTVLEATEEGDTVQVIVTQ